MNREPEAPVTLPQKFALPAGRYILAFTEQAYVHAIEEGGVPVDEREANCG